MSKTIKNLHEARKAKNDEFYTRFEEVNSEVDNYRNHFRDKSVYCNCDSAKSEFYKYFKIRFSFLGLKSLIATHYDETGDAYKLEFDGETETRTPLGGNGDFRSPECEDILAQSDVVVTNPPFSLFRDFIEQVTSFGKKYLVIGSMNAITYKSIFPLILENKLWVGVTTPKKFLKPDGTFESLGNVLWYTNLPHPKREEVMILFKEYDPSKHLMYDNQEVLYLPRVTEIPVDFFGTMAVPISFLSKHNPDQFEIEGFVNGGWKGWTFQGKHKYDRILIKRK